MILLHSEPLPGHVFPTVTETKWRLKLYSLQRVTSKFCDEWILQLSNNQILQFHHEYILNKALNLWFWSFKPLLLRMYFFPAPAFFSQVWFSLSVNIYISSMFHYVLTFITCILTFQNGLNLTCSFNWYLF